MRDMGIVTGSAAQAVPLVIGKDIVYVHTNIIQLEQWPDGTPAEGLYQYQEIQYGKDEYIWMMAGKSGELEQRLHEIEQSVNAKIDYIGMMTEVL